MIRNAVWDSCNIQIPKGCSFLSRALSLFPPDEMCEHSFLSLPPEQHEGGIDRQQVYVLYQPSFTNQIACQKTFSYSMILWHNHKPFLHILWIRLIKQITIWIFCEITICFGSVLCSLNPPSPLCNRSKHVHIPALHVEVWEITVKDIKWTPWNEPGAARLSALPKEHYLAQCWTCTFSFRHRCYPQADMLRLTDRSHLCFTAVLMLTDGPFHIAFSSFLCALMV